MIKIILAGAACAALLAACNQNTANDATDGVGDAVNATQDAASGVVGQTSAATLGANTTDGFVKALATSDMYELEAARIATAKSSNAKVKELAAMIRTDHTASSAKLKELAPTEAAGTVLPTELDERRKGLIDNLNAASAGDFDRVWLSQQVAAHNEALTMLNGYKDTTATPGLAGLAGELIPKITAHRDQAQAALDAM